MASNDPSNHAEGSDLENLGDHKHIAGKEDATKYFIGTHEVQECLEGEEEVDLHKHKTNCKKNPGHKNFIPVNKLKARHFPAGFREKNILEVTKSMADVTVRIAVKFTSPDRPEFVQGTKDPYPCYNTRGQNSLRTGTGRVGQVIKFTEGKDDYRTCPCPECDQSDTPSKVWWNIHLRTALHVVFDESEARQSSFRLWFDNDKSPVVNIYGWSVGTREAAKTDLCYMYCATHDVEVGVKLKEMSRRFNDLSLKVDTKYSSRTDVDKLTIIVSHPHGCSKQVAIGHWVHRQVDKNGWTKYTYTTCTCPGSSGAMVYRLGCCWSDHPHSGANSNPGGLNYSGVEFELDHGESESYLIWDINGGV